jgi:hypothetical protein
MKDEFITLAKSTPWHHTEQTRYSYELSEAVSMEAYRFGMVCFWSILHDMDGFPNLQELQAAQKERKGTLLSLALHMLAQSQDLNSLELEKLKEVFRYSLTDEHSERAGFDFFAAKLKENEIEGCIPEPVDTSFRVRTTSGAPDQVTSVKVTDADFQVSQG